jgi:pilus assembly protein CpaD
MRSKSALLLLATALAGCSYHPQVQNLADRGVEAVHVPVVTRSDYVFDAAAPGGTLTLTEKARLDGWFRGLDLGYGDSIYVDAPYAGSVRYDVAQIAGNYGMTLQPGAPVTAGDVSPGMARVIVSRARAEVPDCPNWSVPSQPNYNNRMLSNFGCAVNGNLAAMVANPDDLIHGREGSGIGNNTANNKAVIFYRTTPPSGTKGLQATTTKGGGN